MDRIHYLDDNSQDFVDNEPINPCPPDEFFEPEPGEERNCEKPAPMVRYDIGRNSDALIAKKIAEKLKRRHTEVPYCEGQFWRFEKTHWVPIPRVEIERKIKAWDGKTWGGPNGNGYVNINKTRLASILALLEIELQRDGFFDDAPPGVNCEAGFIEFDAGGNPQRPSPHARWQKRRFCARGKWEPGQTGDLWPEGSLRHRLVDGCFRDDPDREEKIALVEEMLGAAMLGIGTQLKDPKAVILHGPTAGNGKSQILDMLQGLLPEDAVSAISPSKFTDEKHLLVLAGKGLNTSDELGSVKAIASDVFKFIVTGSTVTARGVYRDPVKFRPQALHVFACNQLPSFTGGFDRGVFRRLLVLDFNRVIPEDEREVGIGRKIVEQEADGLLAIAVAGASRLLRNRRFTEPKSASEALQSWSQEADPVIGWAAAELDSGLYDAKQPPRVPSSVAYGNFKEWYQEQGYRQHLIPSHKRFTQRLKLLGDQYHFTYDKNHRRFVGMVSRTPTAEEKAEQREAERHINSIGGSP